MASRTRSTLSGGDQATAVAQSTGLRPLSLACPSLLALWRLHRSAGFSACPHIIRIADGFISTSDSSNTPGLRFQRPSEGFYVILDYPIHRTVFVCLDLILLSIIRHLVECPSLSVMPDRPIRLNGLLVKVLSPESSWLTLPI